LQKDVYIRFSDHPLYVTCGARGWVKRSFTNRFPFCSWLTEQWYIARRAVTPSGHMSKTKLYESVFSSHFFIIQHPRQTRKNPTRYTHFGIRHARSIPIPAALSKRPHSHPVGAPLHLLRIPSPPFFILCR
jgi:hypothetical protein